MKNKVTTGKTTPQGFAATTTTTTATTTGNNETSPNFGENRFLLLFVLIYNKNSFKNRMSVIIFYWQQCCEKIATHHVGLNCVTIYSK